MLSLRVTWQSPCPAAPFWRHKGDKCRACEEHIYEVERDSFTPLVFSSSGGMGRAAIVTYQLLFDVSVHGSQSRAGIVQVFLLLLGLAVAAYEGYLATYDV